MTKPLVLIFAYHYPPENVVGAARPYRFSKYLARLGYNCRVFTAADQSGSEDSNVEFVPDPVINRPRSGVRWQFERIVRKVLLPGEVGLQWSYCASRAARKYILAHPSTSVTAFSTFPPLGPHLAAWQLARTEGLPWIADFRDLFPEPRERKEEHPFQMRVYRWLERGTARRANAVIANTNAARVRWQGKYPSFKDKVHVIWNGFDPEHRVAALPTASIDFRVITHTGELYGGRNTRPLLESIARLISNGRLSPTSIRVRLIGTAEAEALPSKEFLDRAQAAGWLDLVNKTIPKQEALRIAQSSDALLLFQLQSAVQVPAKIFEYVQVGRPILAFVSPKSPAAEVLERSGVPFRCVYPNSSPEIIDDIVADFFNLPSTAVAATPWFEQEFNAEKQTLQLDAIIRSLHGKQSLAANSVTMGRPVNKTAAEARKVTKQHNSKTTIGSIDRL